MNLAIRLIQTDDDLQKACRTLNELRQQFTLEDLIQKVKALQTDGYQLICAMDGDRCAGVAGFVIGQKLAWGKHIYIDDLITAGNDRSKGVGSAMVDWLINYAKEHDCGQIHLDSGVQRFGAHKFYLNKGFRIASHHFSRIDL